MAAGTEGPDFYYHDLLVVFSVGNLSPFDVQMPEKWEPLGDDNLKRLKSLKRLISDFKDAQYDVAAAKDPPEEQPTLQRDWRETRDRKKRSLRLLRPLFNAIKHWTEQHRFLLPYVLRKMEEDVSHEKRTNEELLAFVKGPGFPTAEAPPAYDYNPNSGDEEEQPLPDARSRLF